MRDEDKTKAQLIIELASLRQQLAEQKASKPNWLEETLSDSPLHFAAILDIVNDAIISINQKQQIVIFNKGAEQIFGYTKDEIIGQPFDLLIPEKFQTVPYLHLAARISSAIAAQTNEARQELFGRRKNGEEFPAEVSIAKFDLIDQKIFTFVLRDVTERKQSEEILRQAFEQIAIRTAQLREANEALKKEMMERQQAETLMRKLSNALEQTADSVIITNRRGEFEYVNRAFERTTGYTKEEVVGHTPRLLKSGQHEPNFYKKLWQTILSGKVFHATFLNKRKNGELYYEDRTISPLKDSQGHITHFVATGRDITERKQAELDLKASEAFARAILNSLSAHLAVLDQAGAIIAVNNAWTTFALENGAASLEQVGVGCNYFDICQTALEPHTHQAVEVLAGLQAVMNRTIDEFELEYPCHSPVEKRWFLLRAVPLLGHEGGLVLSHIDITSQKLIKEAFQEATQRYRQLFEEAPAMYVLAQDNQGEPIITNCNELFLKTLGYSREEVLGQPLGEFYTPASQLELAAGFQRTLSGKFMAEERQFLAHDGRIIETLLKAVPEFDEGRVIGIRAMYIDISERKKLQRQLEGIYQLGQELTLLRDEAVIIRRVLETTTNLPQFEIVTYGLVDEVTQTLIYCYAIIDQQPIHLDLVFPLAGKPDLGVAVVQSGQALNIPEVQQDPRYVSLPIGPLAHSELCVPLKIGSRIIGVLTAQSIEVEHFTSADQQLLQTLADQTAVALENARLYRETQRKTKELTALNNAIRVMASSLDLQTVLDHILEQLAQVVDYDSAALMLVAGESVKVQAVRGFKEARQILSVDSKIVDYPLFQEMLKSRRPIIIADVKTNPNFRRWIGTEAIRSWAGVPLIVGDQVIGQLSIDKRQPDFYGEPDVELVFTFAQQAAIAIENARLHTETARRVQQLAVLHELDRAINTSLRLEDVYLTFNQQAAHLMPFDRLSIILIQDNQAAHIAYASGREGDLPAIGTAVPLASSVTGWVVRNGQAIVIENVTARNVTFDQDVKMLAANIRSSMVTPLKIKGQVIGTWNISSRQQQAYTSDDMTMGQLMSDQLAIAIENARLYEAEREQYQRLQQSQAQLIQVEKMAALGRLVGSIAHEINNPIQAIQNCMSLLKEEVNERQRPEKLIFYSDIAGNELSRIATIVRRMRDFYRPAHQELALPSSASTSIDDFYRLRHEELRVIEAHTILEEVLQLVGKQLQHGDVKVECSWMDSLPPIEGSPDHLKQVFLNLILNALDAMAGRGGVLRLRTGLEQAQLGDNQLHNMLFIEFSDTGKGMSAKVMSRIFEPLFTTKEHGSGFGLFTSYKIIQAHQGHIKVASQVGLGTTFTVLLPVVQS
ncbi:MAG: PAS domain S-box protein [Anaerolineae bacterium]